MHPTLRKVAREIPLIRKVWARHRSGQLQRRYRHWTEKYGRMADELGLSYDDRTARERIRAHLKGRNIQPKLRGECHSAIVTLTCNWGIGMVYELEELGLVSVFDWEKYGFSESDPNLQPRLPELNALMLKFLREAHQRHPIDWVLITCSGNVILKDTLRHIREELGILTVNQCLDCKQMFEAGPGPHGQDLGQRDIAPEFDMVWTTSRSVCEWYMAVGARPVFLSPGFSPRLTPRVNCVKTIDVGFLGACYGLRPDYIDALRRAGLSVRVGGYGWDGNAVIPLDKMGQFFGSCKVNLGMGGIGYSMKLRTVKGRDFEVPGAGGAYLTTYNPDLASFFHIGEEILCYQSMDEMVELACRLVRDDTFRESLANKAYARSMREHRWLHRFTTILEIMGVLHAADGEAKRASHPYKGQCLL